MDFHALPRRDLQALAKRNGVRANMSNVAMADALAALPKVDGIDEYVKEPVVEPTPAAEPEVQAATEEEEKQAPAAEEQKQEATAPEEEEEEEEEREKQEISLPGGTSALKPQEVIMLDDSEEEEKGLMPDLDEEKAPARGVGRRRAIRCAPVEPVAAPATRKRGTAASKAEPAEAVPARTTRARSQRTEVSAAEEGAPKARRTSRRAAASMTGIDQEEEEKDTQGDVSDMETDVPAPVSSDEGGDRAEEMEAPMDAQDKEQNEPVEEQSKEDEGETETGDAAAEAVPARATRARSKRTVESVAEDDAPKARRTSRRAAARKTSTEQEEEEKRTQGDVSDVEAAVPALVSSDEGGDGAEKMEVAVDAQNEEQNGPVEEQSQEDEGEEAVPARATRARRQRTVVSAAEEEAPKVRRTSRRAVARKTSTEQEEEEKAAERDVSEMEAAMPAPVSSDKGGDGAEEMEAAMDAQNEEQLAAAEAVPARPTRSRRQRAVMSAAEEEAPKARRTSRSAVARKTSTEQEEEEKRAQGDVSVVEAAVPAPSSDDGAEDMEAAVDAQNEEQHELVEEQSPDNEGVVVDIPAPVEEEPPVAEDCMVDSSVEEQLVGVQQCDGSPVVLGLSEQEGSDGFQNDAVSIEGVHHASEDTEIVAVDKVLQTPLKSGEAIEEVDFTSSVGHASEEKEVPTSEEVLQSAVKAIDEQEDMAADGVTNNTDVSVEDMAGHTSEENEDCTAEDEPLVAEDVDSSVQELLVHVQQCEETHLAGEDTEVVPEVPQAMLESGEAMEEVDCTSDVGELNEDCTVEEEPLVAEHVGSSQQEPLVDVQQCEATEEEIHLAGEDAETVPVNEVPQATTEEVDFTSNAGHVTVEEELTMAADVDSPVQGPLVAVQQCEATEEIHLVVEVTEMVPRAMMESGEATEEVDWTSDAREENGGCTVEEELPVADDVDSAVQEPMVDVQQCEATEETHLASEDTEMVPVLESAEATEEVDFTSDVGYASEEIEVPASDEMVQSAAKAVGYASEDTEMVPVLESGEATEEVDFTSDVGYASEEIEVSGEATEEVDFTSDVSYASEEIEVPASDEMVQSAAKAVGYASEEIEVPASDEMVQSAAKAIEESELPSSGEVLQSAATAVEENEEMAADEHVEDEAVVATDEMPQRSEAMDEGVVEVVTVDNLSQATVTDDESGFTADLTAEEEAAVTADEMPLSLATMDESVKEEVVTVEIMSQATVTCDLADVFVEEKEVVAADGMPRRSATMEENVEEVVTVDNLLQADEGAVKDVPVEEEGVVAADEIPHSSATMDEDVEEEAVTVENLSQATVADDEVNQIGSTADLADVSSEEEAAVAADETPQRSVAMDKSVEDFVTIESLSSLSQGLSQATVTDDEGAVKESVFSCGLAVLSVDEEGVMAADEMQLTSATMYKSVEEMDTVDNLSQATVTDDEWAVKESASALTGDCTPVVDTATDFSDHIASLLSANVFEDATKSLSMDSITVEPMVSEPADVPLFMYGSSGGEKNASVPLSVQQEKEVKVGNEPDALGSFSTRKLRIKLKEKVAVAQESVADGVPLFMYGSSGGEKNASVPLSVQQEKEVKVGNEPDALGSFSTRKLSALGSCSTRKLRIKLKEKVAVAQESVADGVPLCIFSSIGGEENSAEPVVVEREKECNESEALDSHSLRKLRIELNEKVAVAQENEVKEGEKSSVPLDKLSLRKLRIKLRETLNAQKNMEPKRVPLGRLDENAY